MGRNNQRRRADKKRKNQRRYAGHVGAAPGSGGPREAFDRWAIEMTAISGANAARARDEGGTEQAVTSLVRHAVSIGSRPVTQTVGGLFASVLAGAWAGGWQPLEVVRQVHRRRRDAHASLVVAAMGSSACWEEAGGEAMPDLWSAQLDQLGAPVDRGGTGDWLGASLASSAATFDAGLRMTVEALGELLGLSVIEALVPRPAQWREAARLGIWTKGDDPILAKVRALLAKAESTGFEAEAEALTAKAQELMARHAIDDALARIASPRGESPITRRIAIDDPYAEAKSTLLRVVVTVNGARCVWYSGYAMMAVIGFRSDLDAIEVLFTSLLVQASRAMLEKGAVTDRNGRSRTRSFRQSFLVAYAGRIRERLEMAAMVARRDAEEEMAVSLVPALRARDQELDDAMAEAFPHLRLTSGPAVTSEAGWRAGRIAAELATLGPQQGMLDGMTATG